MLVTSDDGSVHFFKEDSIAWNKEESLSHAIEVEFLDLPEKKLWTQEVDELGMKFDIKIISNNSALYFALN